MANDTTHQLSFRSPSFSWPFWQAFRLFIRSGHLKVRDWKGDTREFGDKTGKTIAIHFRDEKIQRAFLLDPQLAFAEGYMNGDIEIGSGSLYDVLVLLVENIKANSLPPWMRITDNFRFLTRFARQMNNLRQSKRNVSHHYDLPGSLYDLFLDKDKQYSCAYFAPGIKMLDEAQLAKKRHIAAKLCLSPGQSVLDIGSGWGG